MSDNLAKFSPAQIITVITCAVAIAIAVILIDRTVYAQSPPAVAPPSSSLETRVAQRKAERNLVIAPKDQQRLLAVCVSAQTKVRVLQQKTTLAVAKQAKANQQIDAKLWVMIGKLKIAEKDTFKLEKQRAELADKASALQLTSQSYTQSLDDLVAVNCRADPAGFKSLLETARIFRTQLRAQSTDVSSYINNDIKPSLSTFAAELQPKPSTEEGR